MWAAMKSLKVVVMETAASVFAAYALRLTLLKQLQLYWPYCMRMTMMWRLTVVVLKGIDSVRKPLLMVVMLVVTKIPLEKQHCWLLGFEFLPILLFYNSVLIYMIWN